MKSRDRRAEKMSEFVRNMFQYNVTVGITRSEVIFFNHVSKKTCHRAPVKLERSFGVSFCVSSVK